MQQRTLATALLLSITPGLAQAQTDLRMHAGDSAGERLGSSVAGGFDVDGDLVPDSLLGAPYAGGAGPMAGAARAVSGATGAVLFDLAGDSAGDLFGVSVAGGDLDGDGRAELIVGAYGDDANGSNCGTVYVYSGFDGSLLRTHSGQAGEHQGFAVAFVPDVNGDGLGEVLAGARAADYSGQNAGCARLYSGADGALLYELHGEVAFDLFGSAVAGLEDLDGDGRGDLAVGSYLSDFSGMGSGSVYVYSGATGNMLYALRGAKQGDALGYAIADAGDVNGDGRTDLLVGAPSADDNGVNSGRANLYSGVDGSLIRAFAGDAPGDNFGAAVAGRLRLDVDAAADFAVGALASDANGTSAGMVRLFSGADGSEVATVLGASAGARLGAALASAGDTDADGLSEVLLGAWGEDPGQGAFSGAVHVLTLGAPPLLVSNYCASNFNSNGMRALITHAGSTSLAAQDFELRSAGLPAGQPGLFFYGSAQVQVPFGDGFRCVGGQVFRLGTVTTDAGGQASLLVDYAAPPEPAGQITAGSQWNFQLWYRDPASLASGFNLTDGLSASFVF